MGRLEHSVRERKLLDGLPCADEPAAAVAALRKLGARHRIPQVYSWVSQEADREEVIRFLHAEGGPDHGFDDLVAMCQLGLAAGPKTELARNYWDEMGNGDPAQTHTELFRLTSSELGERPAGEPPVAALRRDLLMSLFSVRHDLQHLMLGALALVELQAGPRCELVLQGMRRVGLNNESMRFYEVHARVDPTHGQNWLTKVVMPVVAAHPWTAREIIRGAAWRVVTDLDFFACLDSEFRSMAPSQAL